MSRSAMTRINIHITPQQHARLEKFRASSGVGVSELVRRAVDFYVAFAERTDVHPEPEPEPENDDFEYTEDTEGLD